MPVIAVIVLIRCILPLLRGTKNEAPWGVLVTSDGVQFPLAHWENSIGRSKMSDIMIDLPFISRQHAVLTYCNGCWNVADLGSKEGVKINGVIINGKQTVLPGDTLSFGELDLHLHITENRSGDLCNSTETPGRPARPLRSGITLFLILVFQILGGLQLFANKNAKIGIEIPLVIALFLFLELFYYFYIRFRKKEKYFELELLAFFLCGIGLLTISSAAPDSMPKQFLAVIAGVFAFSVLVNWLRDLDRAQKMKIIFLAAALVLLILNLVLGKTQNGAKNWIDLGFATFQPFEFVKIAFIMAGAATLERLLTARSMTGFLLFTGACIGTLALIRDFGTALVFFCAFLVISFMRSGDWRTIVFLSAGIVLGGFAVITFFPYVSSRFAVWGHVWEQASASGYQQTRTMIAAASGGLLGSGIGNGYLSGVFAADTDLVFGVICEEMGFIIALTAVLMIALFVAFTVSSVGKCRSSFYAIAACGASAIFLTQTALNVFGSFDLLPLTGVTLPFISNGGSSMLTCWCLLAFIKSADERFVPNNILVETCLAQTDRETAAGKDGLAGKGS